MLPSVQGPNPPIAATATGRTLASGDTDAAHAHDVNADQAARDTAELRELERAEYYPKDSAASEPVSRSRRRSLRDRLFRR
jgi:hypothetical protein